MYQIRAYAIQVPLGTNLCGSFNCESRKQERIWNSWPPCIIVDVRRKSWNTCAIHRITAASKLLGLYNLIAKASENQQFDWSNVNIHITIPLRGRLKRLLVTVPNTKHAWKTAADQILSGAGLITFGKYYLSIGYLAKIVQTPNSSPYQKAGSIINQQDNRCAQQKMNGNTMEI